jgi:DNA-binding IclR family transcriptional regulator
MRKGASKPVIAVLQKLFIVLEAFSELGDPMALARLTEATGLPKPTIYRVVQTMVDLGYLSQDPASGLYSRTSAFEWLGRGCLPGHLRQLYRPAMEALRDRFDESFVLIVLAGLKIDCLLAVETTQLLRCMVGPRRGLPWQVTAGGRAIAAFLPLAEREDLIARSDMQPRTPQTVRSKRQLRAKLDEIRADGWAAQAQESEIGVSAVAVPLFEGDRPIAALAAVVPHVRMTETLRRQMIQALLAAAGGRTGSPS